MTLRSWRAVLVLSLTACARYEWRNELDVPGLCDGLRSDSLKSVISHSDGEGGAAHVVRGRVTDRGSGVALAYARVRLVTPLGSASESTAATGTFQFPAPPDGRYVIEVTRLGYHRAADTIDVRADKPISVQARLVPQVNDGPCSGFSSVRVRKPWWKVW